MPFLLVHFYIFNICLSSTKTFTGSPLPFLKNLRGLKKSLPSVKMIYNRNKQIIKLFNNFETFDKSFKNRCVTCVFMQKMEYAQTISGRCISLRSRGKIKSILVRNKKYGIEARFLLNNPRFIVFK